MELKVLIAIALVLVALIAIGGFLYTWFEGGGASGDMKNLLAVSRAGGFENTRDAREALANDETGQVLERLKRAQKKKKRPRGKQTTLEQRYFLAGLFTERQRKEFERLRILLPAIGAPVLALLCYIFFQSGEFALYGAAMGGIGGFWFPGNMLDRRIKERDEDILFYLPLVIEQIAIGVSSSLDIGPCLSRVVTMAEERESHNVVTELIALVQNQVRSGVSLDEALAEIGATGGNAELKHTFMALAQVSRHGGEISRQLQELADAVASMRETRIEGVIKKLELKATGPVGLVFLGFIIILLIGFGIQIKNAFV